MATAEVRFMGIHRDTNEGLSPDGECMQLIGATATEDGIKMLEVPKEEHYVSGNFTNIKWFAKGNCYLAIDSAKHLVRFTEGANNSSEQAINSSEQANNSTELDVVLTAYVEQDGEQVGIVITGYETVGNMICCFTDDGIYYVLRSGEGDSEEYKQLGYGLPYPTLYVSDMEQKVYYEGMDVPVDTYGETTVRYHLDSLLSINRAVVGLWQKAKSRAHREKYLVDRAFYRVGIRLFDGTIVNLSPIVCAEPAQVEFTKKIYNATYTSDDVYPFAVSNAGYDFNDLPSTKRIKTRDSASFVGSMEATQGHEYDYVVAGVAGFKPELVIDCADLSDYKDLISGIEVYTTGSVLCTRETTSYVSTGGAGSDCEMLSNYTNAEYKDLVQSAIFRKCMTFDENLNKTWEVESYDQDTLQVQEAMVDSLINSQYSADVSYVYNHRLHIANYQELLGIRYDVSKCSGMMGLVETDGFQKIDYSTHAYYRVKSLDKVDVVSSQVQYYYQAWYCNTMTNQPFKTIYTRFLLPLLSDMIPDDPLSGGEQLYYYNSSFQELTGATVSGYRVVPRNQRETTFHSLVEERQQELFVSSENGASYVAVTLHTTEGDKTIYNKPPYMPPLELIANSTVSYPDLRAVELCYYQVRSGTRYGRVFELDKRGADNLALYFNATADYNGSATAIQGSYGNEVEKLSASDVLKVSGLDNPLVFPSRQTYQLDGAIVGMQANTEELGEGQHGENPLYVFTDVGTWAMYVDKTGQTVYPYTDAVSGDVLSGDVVSLPDGIVMVTSRGLMMLRGKQRTLLSGALEGEDSWLLPESTSQQANESTSGLTGGDAMVRKVTEVSLIADEAKVRNERFREYLQECRLGYDYVHGLLYVSRADKAYTYVYNLASGEWSKMAVTVKDWVSVWPKCVFTVEVNEVNESTSQQVNVTTELWTTDNMAVENSKLLLISRPVKVARGLKKLDQFAVEGFIRQSTESLSDGDGDGDSRWEDYGKEIDFEGETMSGAQRLCVYVLGSLDGLSYQLAGACATGKPTTRMVGRFLRTNAYRYFIVCVVGGLKTNSIVNDVVLDAAEAYNRRLR